MLAIITPNEKRNFDNKIIIIHGRNFFYHYDNRLLSLKTTYSNSSWYCNDMTLSLSLGH